MSHEEGASTPARSIFSARPSGDEKHYFDMIDRAFASKDDKIISNGKPAHAVYLIWKFLETAREKILVYTGHLSQVFGDPPVLAWGEPRLAQAAIKFLTEREGHLNIVITEKPDVNEEHDIKDHPLLKSLYDTYTGKGRVDVFCSSKETSSVSPFHYITMDDEALRLEIDPDKAKAYVRLDDRETCGVLNDIFERQAQDSARLFSLPG